MKHSPLPMILALAGCASAPSPTLVTVTTVHTPETLVIATEPQPPAVVVTEPGRVITGPVEATPPEVAVGAGGGLRCPSPQRALAGSPVTLRAEGYAPGTRLRWTVTQSPQARWYRFAPRFDPNDSDSIVAMGAEVPFTSVIVGDYTVHLDARDEQGATTSCETTVSMLGHGLRVELSWDTDGTDVDLHLASQPVPRWFTPSDCYYASRTPEGSAEASPQARWLDVDDVDGRGPENIRVDVPHTNGEYTVGVHYYSSHGQSGITNAQVVVYCGEQRVAQFSRGLMGDRGERNDFWRVAGVRFDGSGGCQVRPINEVVTRQQAASPG
ncbi:MAG: hypothetical protein R3A48_08215 [Polyangiales bacterium]